MHFARSLVAFLCAAFLLLAASQASAQGRRMALVIGNNAYPNLDNRSQLQTAVNDADAVARALGDMGFESPTVVHNATRAQFIEALYDFAAKLNKDDAAVFYFAGHGVNFGANLYLPSDIPRPRNNTKAEEARLASSAISEKEIIQTIAASGARITFAIFDACRDNPLNVEGDRSRSLGDSRGLAVEMSQAEGVAVLYSASYGQRALDRLSTDTATQGLNSVFTRILIEELAVAGQGIRALADKLKVRVPALALQEDGHLQRPAYYDEMVGEFVLSGAAIEVNAAPASGAATTRNDSPSDDGSSSKAPEPASPAPGTQPEQLTMIPDGNPQVGPPPGQTANPAPGALASVVWVGRIGDEAFREEWQLVSRDEASRDVVVNYTKRNIDTKRVEAASIDTIPMNSIEPFNGASLEFSCVPGKHIVRRVQKCPGFSCGHTEEELCHYAIPLSVGSVSNEQIRVNWIGLVGERQ